MENRNIFLDTVEFKIDKFSEIVELQGFSLLHVTLHYVFMINILI